MFWIYSLDTPVTVANCIKVYRDSLQRMYIRILVVTVSGGGESKIFSYLEGWHHWQDQAQISGSMDTTCSIRRIPAGWKTHPFFNRKKHLFFFGRFPCFRLDFFSTQSFDVLDFPMRCFNVVACREGLIADIEPHVFREETGNPEKKWTWSFSTVTWKKCLWFLAKLNFPLQQTGLILVGISFASWKP